jgi:hypothetical protein
MTDKTTDLQQWIARVQKAKSAKEVYSVLDEFRPGPWNEDERAKMAKAYIRVLERVGAPPPEVAVEEEADGNDGPVWYEKM